MLPNSAHSRKTWREKDRNERIFRTDIYCSSQISFVDYSSGQQQQQQKQNWINLSRFADERVRIISKIQPPVSQFGPIRLFRSKPLMGLGSCSLRIGPTRQSKRAQPILFPWMGKIDSCPFRIGNSSQRKVPLSVVHELDLIVGGKINVSFGVCMHLFARITA